MPGRQLIAHVLLLNNTLPYTQYVQFVNELHVKHGDSHNLQILFS